MSKTKAARNNAAEKYKMDYRGIVLNALVSILSSASATAVTSFLTAIPASQLPAVAAGIFVAQVLPKLVIEVHRAYIRNKARREGYKAGFKDGDDWRDTQSGIVSSLVSMCESMSYY